jgi:hypothetical protein
LQLTDTNTLEARPSASEGTVRATWSQEESNNAVWIYYWDGAQVTNLDRGFQASLNSGAGAYVQSVQASMDIIYWGRDPPRKYLNVSSDTHYDRWPSLNNGQIAWQKDRGEWEIFYWEGKVTRRIDYGTFPSLYSGTIAYQGFDGNDWGIYYWNGLEVIQVTDNNYHDQLPSLYDGKIAWRADLNNSGTDDSEIMYWDASTIYRITDNSVFECPFLIWESNRMVWL